jgi:hypothetical protein
MDLHQCSLTSETSNPLVEKHIIGTHSQLSFQLEENYGLGRIANSWITLGL